MYTSALQSELRPNGLGDTSIMILPVVCCLGRNDFSAKKGKVIKMAKELLERWEAEMEEVGGRAGY
jgi:hypothetical protein